jgi:hypothetical protein
MSELLKLAERCEKATGPDRELDVCIWAAITPADTYRRIEPGKSYSTWQIRDKPSGEWRDYYPSLNAKRYTETLDAAVTLVPEGWFWMLCQQPVSARVWTEGNHAHSVPRGQTDIRPATPILALIVACLRARDALSRVGRMPESSS